MTSRRIGWALAAGALTLAMTGCQSGSDNAGKSPASPVPATPVASADIVQTPADVTGAPTVTLSTVTLSKKWVPKLDTAAGKPAANCKDVHTHKCATAVAAVYDVARGFWNDVQSTGTVGRYVHAKPAADKVTGAGASYDYYQCGTAAGKKHDTFCAQRVVDIITGSAMLKFEILQDERDAGLS